jgi:mannan polymerase II complex MNN11 subunit
MNTFKPKYGKSPLFSRWLNTLHTLAPKYRLGAIVVFLILWVIYFGGMSFSLFGHNGKHNEMPRPHPLTSKHTIETSSKYIYPPVEHAMQLKQLGVENLVEEIRVRDANFPEIEKSMIRSLNFYDHPNPLQQKQKEDGENAASDLAKAKNFFKNQDKIVFSPKSSSSYPEIVVVTAIDFEKYSLDSLIKVVQNRVDYAHNQDYGVYVRWYQEFLPVLNSFSYLKHSEQRKWIRLYCLRAAMFAFPETKWFWYLDEDGLIMDISTDLNKYMLDAEKLDPIMLREQAIIPPSGLIKTYKNSKAESAKLILTQSEEKVETSSFLVKNDVVGRAIIEIWGDSLFLNYPGFPNGPESSLTHILQWHPFVLSKTAIVPAKTIASKHTETEPDPEDKYAYVDGDFVVQFADCAGPKCEEAINHYFTKYKSSSS